LKAYFVIYFCISLFLFFLQAHAGFFRSAYECVSERETVRETDGDRESQRERQTDTDRDRQTQTETDSLRGGEKQGGAEKGPTHAKPHTPSLRNLNLELNSTPYTRRQEEGAETAKTYQKKKTYQGTRRRR